MLTNDSLCMRDSVDVIATAAGAAHIDAVPDGLGGDSNGILNSRTAPRSGVYDPSVEGRIFCTGRSIRGGRRMRQSARADAAANGVPRENVSRAEEPEGQAHNEVRHRGFTAVRKVFVRKVPRRMLAAMRNEAKDVWMQKSCQSLPVFSA